MSEPRVLEYSVQSLAKDSHIAVQFRLRQPRQIEYRVEASAAVAAYIVTPRELASFRRGDSFSPEVGYRRRVDHEGWAGLEAGLYYLLVINYNSDAVAIHYSLAEKR